MYFIFQYSFAHSLLQPQANNIFDNVAVFPVRAH